jgi:hypothetical protein
MGASRIRSALAGLVILLLTLPACGLAKAGNPSQTTTILPAPTASPDAVTNATPIRQAITAVLDPATNRNAERLPRVTIDPTGDVTVVFALRDEGSIDAIRARGMADTLTILRAVYHSPQARQVTTATVLGTYSITGASNRARERTVMRAVLSAHKADGINWQDTQAQQLPQLVDVWWLSPVLMDQGAPVASTSSSSTVITLPEIDDQINIMLLHLNQALYALSANDVPIARSQYKQFFDVWDRVDDEAIHPLYPERYDQIDLELNKAEIALYHSMPEDLDGARSAMLVLRTDLLDFAHDLEARIKAGQH